MWFLNLAISISLVNTLTLNDEGSCTLLNLFTGEGLYLPRYILYDVNQLEGFNLRRDVYMRLAIFLHKVRTNKLENWHLVLPPWTRIYHWRTTDPHTLVPWRRFFDLESLQNYAPVIEMDKFLEDNKRRKIGTIYILQHFPDAFIDPDNYNWEERWEISKCKQKKFRLMKNDRYTGGFLEHYGVTADHVKCVSYFGQAQQLQEIISVTKSRSIMFDHAEIALHDEFGSKTYWKCRRSMRFALPLVNKAAEFRSRYLNSDDKSDKTIRPNDWRQEKIGRGAVGGPYLCVHMRRQDFVLARPDSIPSLKHAAEQIKQKLKSLDFNTVFVATDAIDEEFKELRKLLKKFAVIRFIPSKEDQLLYTDGGISIIDQIICSHARYFLGSHESTFSFRIEEEREVMGFPVNSTFNRLCGDKELNCSQPTKWMIKY